MADRARALEYDEDGGEFNSGLWRAGGSVSEGETVVVEITNGADRRFSAGEKRGTVTYFDRDPSGGGTVVLRFDNGEKYRDRDREWQVKANGEATTRRGGNSRWNPVGMVTSPENTAVVDGA